MPKYSPLTPTIAIRADFYIQIASLALLYYDYLLTLPLEVKYVWSKRSYLLSPSTFFYFCCRYSLIANLLYTLIKVGRPEVQLGQISYPGLTCENVTITAGALSIFGHIGILAVWGLRTHAMCDRNKIISSILALIAAAVIASLIAKEGLARCTDNAALTKLGLATAVLVFFFEIMAFVVAAVRAWTAIREDTKFWDNPRKSLHYIIFSQGLLYLSAVLTITIITAVCNLQVWDGFARPLNSLKLPLSTLLTARFLLHLRKWHAVSKSNSSSINNASTGIHAGAGWANARRSPGGRGGVTSGSIAFEPVRASEGEAYDSYGTTSTGMGAGVGTLDERSENDHETRRQEGGRGRALNILKSTGRVVEELGANLGPTRSEEEVTGRRVTRSTSLGVEEGEEEVEMRAQGTKRSQLSGPLGGREVEEERLSNEVKPRQLL
ncbi:hypothetical protein DFP72DRAFT_900205 [Ephemerocybe angulata]|uniref:DUF6533 domain-containing protein n=1 Tax=Ephemerocybe angulata TaxID=980116 RepID=A0A8H6HYB1_9AGAR|nr:hypothetical protein DFP72DRAFT_900205 [Tulosesus angulatus]